MKETFGKFKINKIVLFVLMATMLMMMSGCMPGDGSYTGDNYAGFFWGIWHGWIAPISLIRGFFNPEIRVYEPYNIGWWYDLGFYIAVVGGFGGISLFRNKRKNKDRD